MSEEGKKMFNSLSEKEQKTLVEKIKEIIKTLSGENADLELQTSSRIPV